MDFEKLKELSKKQVRYWCFRFKSEVKEDTPAEGAPEGLKKYFEEHEDFIGWEYFNESRGWDVNFESPLEIRPLRFGSDELWNAELQKTAKALPEEVMGTVMISNKEGKQNKRKTKSKAGVKEEVEAVVETVEEPKALEVVEDQPEPIVDEMAQIAKKAGVPLED